MSAEADANTPLLGFITAYRIEDSTAIVEDIGRSWKWILAYGIFNVVGGVLCLMAPITATIISEAIIATTLILVGVINLLGVCFVERNMKGHSFLLGSVQVLLGVIIGKNLFEALEVVTIIIAVVVLLDGFHRVVVSLQHPDLPARRLTLSGGLASIALGVVVLSAFPGSSWWLIGTLVGVHLVTVGIVRIRVGFEGRHIFNAASASNAEASSSLV